MPAKIARSAVPRLPDHTQLPDEDGSIVHNFEELKQGMLLTDCLEPVLERLHPDGRYCIGQDTGIYWRLPAPGEPPGQAAIAPDWFYVPGVARGRKAGFFDPTSCGRKRSRRSLRSNTSRAVVVRSAIRRL